MEFTITMAATTVAIATSVALVYSEAKRSEAERALRLAVRRLADAESCVAQYDEEISRLEACVEALEEQADDMMECRRALVKFVVERCLVQRNGRRRWFSRITSIRFKDRVVANLKEDPRFEVWEQEVAGPTIYWS